MNENEPQNFNATPANNPGGNPNKNLLYVIGAIVAVVILAATGFFWWQTQQEEGQKTQQVAFQVISAADNEDYGDVYFITAEGERRLIAESSRHTSPLDPDTGYQDVRRTMRYLNSEVQVSPNKRWVLLNASCWETACPQVYDTESGEIHFVEPGYSNEITWLADNRLHFEGWCDYPGIICHEDVYESASQNRPWEMQQVTGSANETENWQTYHNEEYGYEIKYPGSHKTTDGSRFPETVGIARGVGEEKLIEANIFVTVREESTVIGFHGTQTPIPESQTDQKIVSSEKVDINGIPFTKKYWNQGNTTISAHTSRNGKVYTLSFAQIPGREETQIFNQILSSFRFVKNANVKIGLQKTGAAGANKYYSDGRVGVRIVNESPSSIFVKYWERGNLEAVWQKKENNEWKTTANLRSIRCHEIPSFQNLSYSFDLTIDTFFNTLLQTGEYRILTEYWDNETCEGEPTQLISGEFEIVDRSPFASICREKDTFVGFAKEINFVSDVENEQLLFCDPRTSYKGQNYFMYVIDGEEILWEKEFYSASAWPSVVEVDGDGLDEIYWVTTGCGGTCTGCSTVYNLYSPRHNETLQRIERVWFEETCTDLVEQPTEYSPNLEGDQYKIFKDYLNKQTFSPV